jgi:hypothetical protein
VLRPRRLLEEESQHLASRVGAGRVGAWRTDGLFPVRDP